MTTVSLSAPPILQFFNNLGQPNAGGSLLTQVGNVNYVTYQDSAGTTPLPNPIPLNARGEISNAAGTTCQLFLVSGVTYTFTLYDNLGNQINQAPYVPATDSASQIGFIQSGTGAVARTMQAKARDVISIKDFGAIGDGTTDDSAAITACIAAAIAANAGQVFVPAGTYKIASTITVDLASPLVFFGTAGGATNIVGNANSLYKAGASRFINATGGSAAIILKNTNTVGQNMSANITFEDIGFQNDLNANNIAVDDRKGYDKTSFVRCSFIGGLKGYTSTTGNFNAKFDGCDFFNCTYGCYFIAGVDTLNMVWENCKFRYCGNAIYALDGNSFYAYNCLFEACTSDACYLDSVYNSSFVGCHWEQNGGSAGTNYDIWVKGTLHSPKLLSLTGLNTFSRDTVTAPGTPQMVQVQVDDCNLGVFIGNRFGGTAGGTASIRWATAGGRTFIDLENSLDNPIVDANHARFGYDERSNIGGFGTPWVPSFNGLTVVGAATYTGNYIKIGNVVHWTARIVPTGAGTTASTLGTTYINNPPFTPLQLGMQSCTAINDSDITVIGQGIIRGAGVNVFMMPTWAALNKTITISGSYIALMTT